MMTRDEETGFNMPIEYKMRHVTPLDPLEEDRIKVLARNYAKHVATCALNRKKRKSKKKSR